MPLKLNTASNGSVTIDAANTASNFTLTVPAQTGTVVVSDSSGNVGIGTSSPVRPLNVKGGTTTTDLAIRIENSDSASVGLFGVYGSSQSTFAGISANDVNLYSTKGLVVYGTDYVKVNTNGSERMRIDSSGNFGIANTNPTAVPTSGFIFQPAWTATGNGSFAVGHVSGSTSGSRYGVFAFNGTEIGSITQNGTTAVSYNTTSDYRLKENIAPMTGALARVQALKPVTYTWKSAPDEIGEGFIAHELAEVCPQAVTGEKDAVNEDGKPNYQSIDTSFLVATLTAAIQELNAKVDAQAAEIALLKGQL